MANLLFLNEDFRISLTGLSYTTDAGATTYLNAATVTYALKDATGTAVSVSSTPVTGTLSYIAASDGNYSATHDKAATSPSVLTEGAKYYLEVTIAEGGRDGFRRLELRAEYRGAT